MTLHYSPRVERVAGDGADAWELHGLALQESQTDPDVIVLSVGDPDFDTPKTIVDRAIGALESGDTHYTSMSGRDNLRDAVAKETMRLGGPAVSADNVTILAGAQNALFTASLCILSPGDEVICLDPMYVTYEAYLGVSGATLVRVKSSADSGFRPDVDAIRNAVNSNTKAIAFSNPANPSGIVFSQHELTAIANIAIEHELWVIADEVYATLTFERPHIPMASLPGMSERTITVSSLSKSHAMTGWRIGWLVANAALIKHVENMSLCMLYGLPGFIQEAAVEALTGSVHESERMRDVYRQRRDLVTKLLSNNPALSLIPAEAGMFIMLDVRGTGLSGAQFAQQLYNSEKVSVLDGAAFADSAIDFVRLSFTNSESVLSEACQRISRFVNTL
ncbi:MAG: pyridoxal phosphate-dependent aminotransferase [Pseudomonadales bacterium]